MLKRNDIVPLYSQLEKKLEQSILAGKYEDRLPSEAELSREHDVSVITVKKALANLAEKGLVQRKQGKGTFVIKQKHSRDFQQVISFSESCRRNNVTPGSRVLLQKTIEAPADIRQILSAEDSVVLISRLRFANDQPVAIETNWFSMDFQFLLDENLENRSLFDAIFKEKKIIMYTARRTIDICYTSAKEARLLKVQTGMPLLYIKSIVYTSDANPVFVGTQKINSEHFKLTI